MDEYFPTDPSWVFKGWPHRPPGTTLDQITAGGLNIFDDEFLFPVATIATDDLDHNIATMARFCRENNVVLAPHAKTTMSPEIIKRQIEAGAWAITAATVSQANAFRRFGVERIIIAHQVIDPAAVRWIAQELDSDPSAQIICLVDSLEAVTAMERALDSSSESESSIERPLDVLVEMGVSGGRSGCRTIDSAVEVAHAVAASIRFRLVGVEGYEGAVPTGVGGVDAFLTNLIHLTRELDDLGHFAELDEIVVTAGGSMFPDRAVAVLGELDSLSRPTRVVIRSGCYVTHDSVMYRSGGPFGSRAPMESYPPLRAAMMVWSYVVSRPEPDLAILGFGKRDASYDVDLPVPLVLRRNGVSFPLDGQLEIFSLNDQHAFVRVTDDIDGSIGDIAVGDISVGDIAVGDIAVGDIAVGDIVGCGISHPCTTFDKWKAIPLVDPSYDVVGAVRTYF